MTQTNTAITPNADWTLLELHLSSARLGRYHKHRSGDQTKAMGDYIHNLQLASAMIPMLHVLEIALRNGIHNHLKGHYKREDWWCKWANDSQFERQYDKLNTTRKRLKPCTPDKLVAELNFGFWVTCFNTNYQDSLWKPLRSIFTRCPKEQRQRHEISTRLNAVRKLRNRVFHHEPLLWLSPDLGQQHQAGIEVIGWIDPKLKQWLQPHDHLPMMWRTYHYSQKPLPQNIRS